MHSYTDWAFIHTHTQREWEHKIGFISIFYGIL